MFLKLIYIYSSNQFALEIFPVPSLKMNCFRCNYYKSSTALSSVLSFFWGIAFQVKFLDTTVNIWKLPMIKFTMHNTETCITLNILHSELL